MTQENKELLLKDLCARLPYGVKTKYVNTFCEIKQIVFEERSTSHLFKGGNLSLSINDIQVWKPYLRLMSSMTEEEKKEWYKESCVDYDCEFQPTPTLALEHCHLSTDWLLKHHFDFRGLIPMGLALEAKEGMYK